jgi:single-stranded-DNA-specific exonuclease
VRDAIAEVDAAAPGLIERFGGHAMAAGLTLERASLEPFEAAFEQVAAQRIEPDQLLRTIRSDGPLTAQDLSVELAQDLLAGGPWGQGFPEPQFDNTVSVVNLRGVGRGHSKMRVQLDGVEIDAIAFGSDADQVREMGHALHLVFALEVNEFRGRQTLQLNVKHLQPA